MTKPEPEREPRAEGIHKWALGIERAIDELGFNVEFDAGVFDDSIDKLNAQVAKLEAEVAELRGRLRFHTGA